MKAEGSGGACSSLIRKILIYVVENPDAKDTLEGITEFWISQNSAQQVTHEVQKALDFLVEAKAWLTKIKAGAAVTLYGLNKDRLGEIKSFLQQTS